MSRLAFGASLLSWSAAALADPKPVRLMALEQKADDLCRGSPDADTPDLCAVRDAIVQRLKQLNWCWNPTGMPEYQASWGVCAEEGALPKFDVNAACSVETDQRYRSGCLAAEQDSYGYLKAIWASIRPDIREACTSMRGVVRADQIHHYSALKQCVVDRQYVADEKQRLQRKSFDPND